jgi:hypothetical protein
MTTMQRPIIPTLIRAYRYMTYHTPKSTPEKVYWQAIGLQELQSDGAERQSASADSAEGSAGGRNRDEDDTALEALDVQLEIVTAALQKAQSVRCSYAFTLFLFPCLPLPIGRPLSLTVSHA